MKSFRTYWKAKSIIFDIHVKDRTENPGVWDGIEPTKYTSAQVRGRVHIDLIFERKKISNYFSLCIYP